MCNNIKINHVKNIFPFQKSITSLNQIYHSISSNKIDFLKIDCEGCEFNIFQNKNNSKLTNIDKLVMEYHENKDHKVNILRQTLEDTGFKVRVFPRKQVETIGLLTAKREMIE